MSVTNIKKIKDVWAKLPVEEQRELLPELARITEEAKRDDNPQRDNIYKRGNSWYVRIWVDGTEIRKSAGRSKDAARILLVRMRNDADRGRMGLSKKSRMTIADWAPRYLEWAKAHKRSAWRDEICWKHLKPAFGHLRFNDVTKARVEVYQRDRQKKVSGPTVNREVAILRKLLSHAVEAGELETNPLARVRMLQESPARQPMLQPKDEERLLRACSNWLASLVRLAVTTGCRQGEILALRWKHVDFDNGALIVEDSKSGDSRRVPLHPSLLEELRTRRGPPEDYVTVQDDGKPPPRYKVSEKFRKAAKSVGLSDLRFHDLRHVAATRLLSSGASLPEVAAVLGHKTLAVSSRYAHTTWTRLRALVADMPLSTIDGESDG